MLKPFFSQMGRPSVDPELMIRMLIVGYCMGIRSERRLCGHWAIAPRRRTSVAAISTTCIPENDVPQMNIRVASMSGLAAAQLITVR